MYFTNAYLLLSLALSASAIVTPHMARNLAHHHALAARAPVAEASAVPVAPVVIPRKRALKRCKATNGTSTALPVAASTSSSAAVASTTAAPVNVGGAVPVFSSSSVEAAPSSSSAAPVKPTTEAPSSSSEAPAKPTTTQAPAKPSTTSQAPEKPTTTKQDPPATTTPSSSSGGSGGDTITGVLTGDATFYSTGLGACGITNHDTDYIAAVSHLLFDTFPGYNGVNPNNNPICNKKVTAHYQGKSVTVTITDRCVGCAYGDLDFSPSAFDQLGSEATGRLHGMTWSFD